MLIVAETWIGNVFARKRTRSYRFFLFLWVKIIYVFLYFILYIFHEEYSKNSRNHETKIFCKIFFTSKFEDNARQPAGLLREDSKAGDMESGERD